MSAITMPPVPSPANTPPPRAGALKPHRFTIGEYRKLGQTGLFHDMKTMLIHGELYVMGMPKPPHDVTLSATYEFLRSACPTVPACCWGISTLSLSCTSPFVHP